MRYSLLLLPILLLAVCSQTLRATIINVPDDEPTIQRGIYVAIDGDTVLVADGTYTGDGNRDIDFHGKAIVVMSENGPEVTIIDCQGSEAEPHRGFYFHSGEDSTSVLQGFTITNGYHESGGGMYNYYSSPTITNCMFINNDSSSIGGGMYNEYSSPTIINCMFSGNQVHAKWGDGGGIYNGYSNPTVTNCTFSQNSADNGGGMENLWSSPTVSNCTFSGNSAWYGGSGMSNDNSNPTVTNCTFSENSVFWHGGGMENLWSSNPAVTNCTFSQNSAIVTGGGMRNYIGMPTVTNCVFSGNLAGEGGGMHNSSSNPTVSNCTFSGNEAYYSGGGMHNAYNSSPIVTDSILWDDIGGEIYNYSESYPIVTYSNVQGGYPGAGNIDADPLFFTFGRFDYFLDASSPCIDTGISHLSPVEPTEDGISDWHPRWPDWIPNSPRPDMGAYGGPGNVGWLQ